MLTDALNTFSEGQAVTATAISANVIDLGPMGGNAVRDIGTGEPKYVVLTVGTAFTAAGAATDTITIESADNAALSSSPVVHASTGAIAVATLAAGYQLVVPLPPGGYKRYLGLRHTIATGPMTAGTITAQVVTGPDLRRDYVSGSTNGV